MSDSNDRTLTIQRTFDAPIALVWEAWTQAGHIAQWWGPKGMEVTVVTHQFQVGGAWEYVMAMPDGTEFISKGVYSEIETFKKVVSPADFIPMTTGVEIHALFKEDGEKTHFTFHCVHPTEEYCKQQEEMGFYNGWGAAFDRLETYIASLRKPA